MKNAAPHCRVSMNAIPVTCLLVLMVVAGCVERQPAPDAPPLSAAAPVEIDPLTGDATFLQPNWTVGRWWNADLTMDSNGFLQQAKGTLVVSGINETGYRVGSDAAAFGILDRYFDQFHIGPFDRGLNATIYGTSVQLLPWPLKAGHEWTTSFPLLDEYYEIRGYNATLKIGTFEDRDPLRNLRIQGETEHGELLDYDYSADTGWMTYYRLTNKTTGRILLSIDYRETGVGFAGDVHHVSRTTLYERFVIGAPVSLLIGDPAIAGVPPADRVVVGAGPQWVEEITFLFSFPIPISAGSASVTYVRPDSKVDPFTHRGVGDRFEFNFNRTVVQTGFQGTWTVSLAAQGTAGALSSLYGFNDDIVTL